MLSIRAMVLFGIGLTISCAAVASVCCVGCGPIVVCAEVVSLPCGSCGGGGGYDELGGQVGGEKDKPAFEAIVSIGNNKSQAFSVRESEATVVREGKDGLSYVLRPKVDDQTRTVSLEISRLVTLFGLKWELPQGKVDVPPAGLRQGITVGQLNLKSFHYSSPK